MTRHSLNLSFLESLGSLAKQFTESNQQNFLEEWQNLVSNLESATTEVNNDTDNYWPLAINTAYSQFKVRLVDVAKPRDAWRFAYAASQTQHYVIPYSSDDNTPQLAFLSNVDIWTEEQLSSKFPDILANPSGYATRIAPNAFDIPRSIFGKNDRQRILDKIQIYWIDNFLKSSFHPDFQQIPLQLDAKPNAVLKHPKYRTYNLSGTSRHIGQIFDDVGRELLILGQPGIGKTILLLQLAERLMLRANRDPLAPIPIVINLASWTSENTSFLDWVTSEIQQQYDTPLKTCRKWIQNQAVVLLLDGLDEISETGQRQTCVAAINTFLEEYPTYPIALCSRIQEVEQLSIQPNLVSAIELQPLTVEQVESYFDPTRHKELLEVSQQDAVLAEFVGIPFLLNMMLSAYADKTYNEINSTSMTREQRIAHLMANYDAHVMNSVQTSQVSLSPTQIEHYLSWLAYALHSQKSRLFQTKTMQPSVLPVSLIKKYELYSGIAISAIIVGIMIIFRGIGLSIETNIVSGFGGVIIVALVLMPMLLWAYKTLKNIGYGIVLGFLFGGALGLSRSIANFLAGDWQRGMDALASNIGIQAIFFIIVFTIAFRGDRLIVDRKRIVFERRQWTLSRAMIGIGVAVITGSIFLAIRTVLTGEVFSSHSIALILFLWGVFGFVGIGFTGHINRVEKIRKAHSINDYALYFLGVGVLISILGAISFGSQNLVGNGDVQPAIIDALWGATWIISGLLFGGIGVIQNIILRRLLYINQNIPFDIAEMLEQLTQVGVIRRVGNSYMFPHKFLETYFLNKYSQE